MNKFLVRLLICYSAVIMQSASAHHAWPVNQERLVTVQGTVTDFDWSNPHPMISIDVLGADGATEKWRIGGPAINRMERNGWSRDTVKPGDVVTGTGFQFSNGEKIIRLERVILPDNTEILVYARR
jgi:hypothetical protein